MCRILVMYCVTVCRILVMYCVTVCRILVMYCVQGSESDTVVYYVGDHRAQNWKHVYTAVTRGRKAVFLVGKESELQQVVWERDRSRRSRLARRLTLMMKDLQFQVKTCSHCYMDRHNHCYRDRRNHCYVDRHNHCYMDRHNHCYRDRHIHCYMNTTYTW